MNFSNNFAFFGFNDMKPDIYLACFSTRLFEFAHQNIADHRGTAYGKDYSSFCQIVEGEVSFEMQDGSILTGKAGDMFYMPEGSRYLSTWRGNPHIVFIGTYFRFLATNDLDILISRKKYIIPFDRRFAFQKVECLSNFRALEEMQAILHEYHAGKHEQLMAFSRIYRLIAIAYPHL
ncbi:MAG: cupin domain-containing protein, partial [Ruminococcaceae bacterium]|nr:cupin domain-containing protein [Oscillospiraceae bacterium]